MAAFYSTFFLWPKDFYPGEHYVEQMFLNNIQYEPKKFCRRAAESGRPLRAANRRLPTPSGNGGERQTPVIFTPRAVLDPMPQTMMDPGTSLPVIPLHESQVTAARLTGGNSFRSLRMYALCTLYTGRIK